MPGSCCQAGLPLAACCSAKLPGFLHASRPQDVGGKLGDTAALLQFCRAQTAGAYLQVTLQHVRPESVTWLPSLLASLVVVLL